MRKVNIKTVLFLLMATLALSAMTAGAADAAKATSAKPKYRKVTGKVVSASPTNIVVKGRSKTPVTLAVTEKTRVVDSRTAKAGDKVAVNYRIDESGKTATKIKVLSP